MGHLLSGVAATGMLAVAAHCLLQIVRLLRAGHAGIAQEVLHVTMAVTMAAMFLGLVSGTFGIVVIVGFGLVAIWLAADLVVRGGPASARLGLSSLAMAVMAWAMARPTAHPTTSMSGMSMPGMSGMGETSGGSGALAHGVIWLSLAAMAALAIWSVRGRRTRDAVMGAAMALMLGSMV